MKTFVKKHWKIILFVGVLLFFAFKFNATFFKSKEVKEAVAPLTEVQSFSLQDIKGGKLNTLCSVQALDDAAIVLESTGKVTEVFIQNGDTVKKGDKLFQVENITQRVAVQNAKVAVRSAELSLSQLLGDNDPDRADSLLNQTQNQQEQLVKQAKNAHYNNDLKAYPQEDPTDVNRPGPFVEGNYTCEEKGEYLIEVYSSSAESGASYRVSGLESGRESVSISAFGTPLGACGLELRFPDNFDKNETWVIPVPNTRSSTYTQTRTAYENALAGKDITLNNTEASPERIAQEKARVTQAKLQLESAYNNLSKTIARASVSGTVSGFDIAVGDFISSGQNLGRVKTIKDLELVAYVNASEQSYIQPGSHAEIDSIETKVVSVAPAIDTLTKKLKVILEVPRDFDLIEGTEQSCRIERTLPENQKNNLLSITDGSIIPLSAISVIGVDTYVFEIKDGKAIKKAVETGALLGESVVVYGLGNEEIIRDARGIRDNQNIQILAEN